jgi:hypothetical protein
MLLSRMTVDRMSHSIMKIGSCMTVVRMKLGRMTLGRKTFGRIILSRITNGMVVE